MATKYRPAPLDKLEGCERVRKATYCYTFCFSTTDQPLQFLRLSVNAGA